MEILPFFDSPLYSKAVLHIERMVWVSSTCLVCENESGVLFTLNSNKSSVGFFRAQCISEENCSNKISALFLTSKYLVHANHGKLRKFIVGQNFPIFFSRPRAMLLDDCEDIGEESMCEHTGVFYYSYGHSVLSRKSYVNHHKKITSLCSTPHGLLVSDENSVYLNSVDGLSIVWSDIRVNKAKQILWDCSLDSIYILDANGVWIVKYDGTSVNSIEFKSVKSSAMTLFNSSLYFSLGKTIVKL
jgi:hypothetical protein